MKRFTRRMAAASGPSMPFFMKKGEGFFSRSEEKDPLFFSPNADEQKQAGLAAQHTASWVSGNVHFDTDPIDAAFYEDRRPITWPALNGQVLKKEADAVSAINTPEISVRQNNGTWEATITDVPANRGSYDLMMYTAWPWEKTMPRQLVGEAMMLPECRRRTGTTRFRINGIPSDGSLFAKVFKHEHHHGRDHAAVFDETIVRWHREAERVKSGGIVYRGTGNTEAVAQLWAALGGTPEEIAKRYFNRCMEKGDDFHYSPEGRSIITVATWANRDCSRSSADMKEKG